MRGRRPVSSPPLRRALLTLVVVPVAYTYFDDFGGWLAAKFGGRRRARVAQADGAAPVPQPVAGD
ncbi:MAG: hypothetical protein ACXWZ4_05185 [Gemmatirosa sp.]